MKSHLPRLLAVPGAIALIASANFSGVRVEQVQSVQAAQALLAGDHRAPSTFHQPFWARVAGLSTGALAVFFFGGSLFPGSQWRKVTAWINGKRKFAVVPPDVTNEEVAAVITGEDVEIEPVATSPVEIEVQSALEDWTPREKLLHKLESEAPWLLRVMRSPLVFVGAQRSGKSSAAQAIALIRKVLFDDDLEWVHPQAAVDGPEISQEFELFGGKQDWSEVSARLKEFCLNLNPKQKTTILDELASWPGKSRIDEETATQAWSVVVSCATKHKQYPILLTHGTTNIFRGGVKGYSKEIDGLPTITIAPAFNTMGEPTFNPEWQLSNIPDVPETVTRPNWLRPEFIIDEFGLKPLGNAGVPKPEVPLTPTEQLVRRVKQDGSVTTLDLVQLGIVAPGEMQKGVDFLENFATENGLRFVPETDSTNASVVR